MVNAKKEDIFHPLAEVENRIDQTNQQLLQTNALLSQLVAKSGLNTLTPAAGINPFSTYTVDLTTEHTFLQITNQTPFRYLQFYCDGPFDGISIRLDNQGADPINLNQMIAVPVNNNPHFMYLTNDVRQGRSKLTIYWVRGDMLSLAQGGQDISLGELAVRNGSMDTFDKRGSILWQDNFEDGLAAYTPYFNGTGASVAISTSLRYKGGVSLKCTTGNAAANYAGITHILPYPASGRYGISFLINPHTGNVQWYIDMMMYDGTNYYEARFLMDILNEKLQIMNTSGTMVDYKTGLAIPYDAHLFNYFKLVVDFQQKKYSRGILNNNNYDLSNYPLRIGTSSLSPAMTVQMETVNQDAGVNNVSYIANYIVTQNES